jgi:hypothetical protein
LTSTNGNSAQFTFSSPGTYYYYCKIHGYTNMHGAVAVSAPATPPATPASPTPKPSGAKGRGATTPGTGAGLGAQILLLPLGFQHGAAFPQHGPSRVAAGLSAAPRRPQGASPAWRTTLRDNGAHRRRTAATRRRPHAFR